MNELTLHQNYDPILDMVVNALPSANSRKMYRSYLTDFLGWMGTHVNGQGLTRALVHEYRSALMERGLAPSTVNLHLAAVRKLASEAAENKVLAEETAAAIGRVKGIPMKGTRLGRWLSIEETRGILKAPVGNSERALRDRALLALLIGCGLRRAEASMLNVEDVQERDGRWVIMDIVGKGERTRSIPMPTWAKEMLDRWLKAANITTGPVFRVISGYQLTEARLGDHAIRRLVGRYGGMAGIPGLNPHDLRRTFAHLAHRGDSPIEQISMSLGHSSVLTTERYLGMKQNFKDAPCDHLGLEGQAEA